MGVWDTSTPAGSDLINQGDDRIREMKTAIQEALRGGASEGDEAIFPGGSASTAPIFRYRGLKGTTAARPAATYGGLYYNTTTGTLQRANGSSWEDLTENAAYEAIHAAVAASLASSSGVITLPETGNAFNVTGTEAVTSFAGWSAGVVIVKWVSARVLTHHATNLILRGGVSRTVAAGDISTFEFTGSGTVREIAAIDSAVITPTKQYLTSGTAATYTTPTNARKLVVKMWGAGGGGGAYSTNAGADGGDSSFNSIVAKGGSGGGAGGGSASGTPGAGGVSGAGSASLRVAGRSGLHVGTNSTNFSGSAGPANSGSGGTGGNNAGLPGGMGGDGEYVEIVISSPATSYTYTIGAGGAGGAAGTFAGGDGGSGLIIVTEYY